MRCNTLVRYTVIATAAVLVGCSLLPGLATSQAVISGTVSGSGLSSATKLAVYFGPPSTRVPADAVLAVRSGAFSYTVPAGENTVSLVPFEDNNGDSKLDPTDPNALDPSSCPDCNYIQAVRSGQTWSVSLIGGTNGSQLVDLTAANIVFNASA